MNKKSAGLAASLLILAIAIVVAAKTVASAVRSAQAREDRRSLGLVLSQAQEIASWCKTMLAPDVRIMGVPLVDSVLALGTFPSWEPQVDEAMTVLADSTNYATLQLTQRLRTLVLGLPGKHKELQDAIIRGTSSEPQRMLNRVRTTGAARDLGFACDAAARLDSAISLRVGVRPGTP